MDYKRFQICTMCEKQETLITFVGVAENKTNVNLCEDCTAEVVNKLSEFFPVVEVIEED